MRILVHNYSGLPFQAQLSRARAEMHFRIDNIANRFEHLCEKIKADYA
jgi:hypothetical protein